MIKGFKEFIMRGNVIDLAVAVVIGAAFAKVVEVVIGERAFRQDCRGGPRRDPGPQRDPTPGAGGLGCTC